MLINATEIEEAEKRIRQYLQPTPLIFSPYYSAKTGANVYLKLDMLHPTHSFKVRGAFNALLSLPAEQLQRGVVSASQGNHGMGVAFAARTLGVTATIFVPESVSANRTTALAKLGAEVIQQGASFDEATRLAQQLTAKSGKAFIHAFNNPDVMAGQGTIVLELVKQLPKIDLLIASIGGGGLISGIISAAQSVSPDTRVAGVETIGADCMQRSRQAHSIVELPAITSVAISLGARRTEQQQFDIVTNYISDLVTVSDEAAIHSLVEFLREERLLIEPAASCSLAALTSKQLAVKPNENVVVIVCGANQSLDQAMHWALREQDSTL